MGKRLYKEFEIRYLKAVFYFPIEMKKLNITTYFHTIVALLATNRAPESDY